ncbi:putative galacturonosyltransferase 10 [Hordeum vulgare]|nr:putative galacturonosyltransferase 10 [Hordeum vulgare]
MVRPTGLLDLTTRWCSFLDQRRPSFRRRWKQRPLWARLLLSLLLGLAGSPDTSSPPHFAAPPSPAFVSEVRTNTNFLGIDPVVDYSIPN